MLVHATNSGGGRGGAHDGASAGADVVQMNKLTGLMQSTEHRPSPTTYMLGQPSMRIHRKDARKSVCVYVHVHVSLNVCT